MAESVAQQMAELQLEVQTLQTKLQTAPSNIDLGNHGQTNSILLKYRRPNNEKTNDLCSLQAHAVV
jgi:hypothetical protein